MEPKAIQTAAAAAVFILCGCAGIGRDRSLMERFEERGISAPALAVESGIFAFLLLVVTSSSVAELHGRATANRLVLIGFVPLIVSLLGVG